MLSTSVGQTTEATADVEVALSGSAPTVPAGGRLTYTAQVRNAGPDDAADVVLEDPLPDRTLFVSAATTRGTVEHPEPGAGGLVRVSLGSLEPDAAATVTIEVMVLGPPGALTNTATASSPTADPEPEDNTATVTTAVMAGNPPSIRTVRAVTSPGAPYRIKIVGANFADGVEVFVGNSDTVWADVNRKSETKLVVGRGRTLKLQFPRGVAVSIRVRNPDGLEAVTTFTRR
jgi:uncharacterized repeat protein (TIGR01451 family)